MLWVLFIIILLFIVIEFVGGLVFNLLVLLLDLFYMFSDVLVFGLFMLVIYFVSKKLIV